MPPLRAEQRALASQIALYPLHNCRGSAGSSRRWFFHSPWLSRLCWIWPPCILSQSLRKRSAKSRPA